MDDETLTDALDASAPLTAEFTHERESALEALVTATKPASRRRRRARTGAVVAGSALLVGLGGVAVAEEVGWTSWWADDAAAEVTYTLPSGLECTEIVGNFKGDPEAVALAEEFMARPDLMESIDPSARYQEAREANRVAHLADGSTEPAGPGTIYWSDDAEYRYALDVAVTEAMYAYMEEHGGDLDGLTSEGEISCPGLVVPDLRGVEITSDAA